VRFNKVIDELKRLFWTIKMQFPILNTKRLLLKPITYKDASNLFELLSQFEVCLYNNFSVLDNKDQAKNLIQQDLENSYNNIGIRFVINKTFDEFIGSCGVHQYDEFNKRAIIGYELDPVHWRKGYMLEALTRLFDYLFSQDCNFEVNQIAANVLNLNIPSIKLLKKLGFVNCDFSEKIDDIIQYRLTKKEWLNNKK